MKRQVIAIKKVSPKVTIDGVGYLLILPSGVSSILYCFNDVESARKYFDTDPNNIELIDSETKKTLTV